MSKSNDFRGASYHLKLILRRIVKLGGAGKLFSPLRGRTEFVKFKT